MPAQSRSQTTGRFVDIFPYIPWFIAGLMLLSLIVGAFMERTLVSTTLAVEPDAVSELKPIQLEKTPIGALRIDVVANLPRNQWMTYEIQVKDSKGNILATGVKQAWSEAGTWSEEGESGSWAEDDLFGSMDIRTNQTEPVTIALDVLEYTDTSGRDIDTAVPFQIEVKNGAIDDRYLWTGLFGSLVVAVLALFSTPATGKAVANKSNYDSDVVVRTTTGGADRLLRVIVKIHTDELSPSGLYVLLTINDANGEQLYSERHPVNIRLFKDDGKVTGGRGSLTTFFVIEPRSSYGFHAEVHPDASVDRTRILVRENARTLLPVNVVTLKSSDVV